MTTITIDGRYCGPPSSGNGGYVCGIVADQVEGPVTVALHAPPPLDVELTVGVPDADGVVEVTHGATTVAVATPATPSAVTPPVRVDLDAARAATERYVGFVEHPFPTCWVCGPARPADDGLHIHPGPIEGSAQHVVASPWTPTAELGDERGDVVARQLWAALDCPSYFGLEGGPPAVLGSLTVDLAAPVPVATEHVVVGWQQRPQEGRRLHGASAVLSAEGDVLASATATWVELSPEVMRRMMGG